MCVYGLFPIPFPIPFLCFPYPQSRDSLCLEVNGSPPLISPLFSFSPFLVGLLPLESVFSLSLFGFQAPQDPADPWRATITLLVVKVLFFLFPTVYFARLYDHHILCCVSRHILGTPLHSRRFHPLSQVSAAVRDRVRCVFRCWHYCNTHLLVVRFTGFLHVCVIC